MLSPKQYFFKNLHENETRRRDVDGKSTVEWKCSRSHENLVKTFNQNVFGQWVTYMEHPDVRFRIATQAGPTGEFTGEDDDDEEIDFGIPEFYQRDQAENEEEGREEEDSKSQEDEMEDDEADALPPGASVLSKLEVNDIIRDWYLTYSLSSRTRTPLPPL